MKKPVIIAAAMLMAACQHEQNGQPVQSVGGGTQVGNPPVAADGSRLIIRNDWGILFSQPSDSVTVKPLDGLSAATELLNYRQDPPVVLDDRMTVDISACGGLVEVKAININYWFWNGTTETISTEITGRFMAPCGGTTICVIRADSPYFEGCEVTVGDDYEHQACPMECWAE